MDQYQGKSYIAGFNDRENMKHSKTGVISFILAISLIVIVIGLIIGYVGFAVQLSNHWQGATPTAGELKTQLHDYLGAHRVYVIMLGIFSFLVPLFSIVGLVLGIIGITRKDRKKSYAISGTIINGIAVLILVLFLIIGITAASSAA